MNSKFSSKLNDFIVLYLNNIFIFLPNAATHRFYLWHTLDKLYTHKIFTKYKECSFRQCKVKFLGHIVGLGYLKVNPIKILSVSSWTTSTYIEKV